MSLKDHHGIYMSPPAGKHGCGQPRVYVKDSSVRSYFLTTCMLYRSRDNRVQAAQLGLLPASETASPKPDTIAESVFPDVVERVSVDPLECSMAASVWEGRRVLSEHLRVQANA